MTIERRRLRVYVAGPISTGNMYDNVHHATLIGREMLKDGLAPYIPHLDAYMLMGDDVSWNTYLEWDLEWVKVAEAVYRLWGESRGGSLEVEMALAEGIPVFYEEMFSPHPSKDAGYQGLLEMASIMDRHPLDRGGALA